MRNMQILNSKHRIDVTAAACMGGEPDPGASADLVAAAVDALNDMGNIVSQQCFANPEALTQGRIMAYALALMRLRECAGAAGLERLMKACDALAVTVSLLIEDRSRACSGKCAALARFVAHARAMIQMSTDGAKHYAPPPAIRPASSRESRSKPNIWRS